MQNLYSEVLNMVKEFETNSVQWEPNGWNFIQTFTVIWWGLFNIKNFHAYLGYIKTGATPNEAIVLVKFNTNVN